MQASSIQAIARRAAFFCAANVLIAFASGAVFQWITIREAVQVTAHGDPYTAMASSFLWLLFIFLFAALAAVCSALVAMGALIAGSIRSRTSPTPGATG